MSQATTVDFRPLVVQWADWAVAHKPWFEYLESRPFPLYVPTAARIIRNDCSATSIWCCWAAGAPAPFPGAYQGTGNTETFLTLEHITSPIPGDFVVYGDGLPLGDQHMAVVVGTGSDPMTMSHGQPSEPRFVNAIEGCPSHAQGRITYVRYLPIVPPTPPKPKPPAPPKEQNVIIATCATISGDWFCVGSRRCHVSPTQLILVEELYAPIKKVVTSAELLALTVTPWGSI